VSNPPAAPSPASDASKVAEAPKAPESRPNLIADAKGESAPEAPATPAAPAAPAAPVEFKVPDGVVFGDKSMAGFKAAVAELGLPADKAQALLDKVLPATAADRAEAAKREIAEVETKWADEFRADKDIGGVKFDASIKKIGFVIDKFGSPALREFLRDTGVGNSKELGGLLVRFYDAIHGHEVIKSNAPAGNAAPLTEDQRLAILYGKTTPA